MRYTNYNLSDPSEKMLYAPPGELNHEASMTTYEQVFGHRPTPTHAWTDARGIIRDFNALAKVREKLGQEKRNELGEKVRVLGEIGLDMGDILPYAGEFTIGHLRRAAMDGNLPKPFSSDTWSLLGDLCWPKRIAERVKAIQPATTIAELGVGFPLVQGLELARELLVHPGVFALEHGGVMLSSASELFKLLQNGGDFYLGAVGALFLRPVLSFIFPKAKDSTIATVAAVIPAAWITISESLINLLPNNTLDPKDIFAGILGAVVVRFILHPLARKIGRRIENVRKNRLAKSFSQNQQNI